MFTEEQIEKALDYLVKSSQEYAQARSSEKFYTHKIKSIEAQLFQEQDKGAVEAKRMAARAHPDYLQALEDYKEAAYNAELIHSYREAAQLKISWQQSLMRAQSGGY